MTEETQQTQPEQQPAAEQTQPQAQPQPSLESLYAEYNVPAQQQPAPQQEVGQAAPTTEPRPEVTDTAAIHQEMAALRRELAADRMKQRQTAELADLDSAIATVGKESGLEGKDTVIKGFLLAKASEDQRLRALWEARGENPQAWNKALKIIANEVKGQFAVPNPQLEENQRAMDESQRAGTTTLPPQKTAEDKALAMSPAEFAQYWGRLAGRG